MVLLLSKTYRMDTGLRVVSWLVHISCVLATLGAANGQVCPGIQTANGCYVIQQTARTRAAAEQDCVSRGTQLGTSGHLAALATQSHNDELNVMLKALYNSQSTDAERQAVQSFWLGGYEESSEFGTADFPVWRWLDGMTPVAHQGCFNDDPRDRDMELKKTISLMFIANCTTYCKANQRAYAGLQNGAECFCSNSYGKHGASSGCIRTCEGTKSPLFTTKEFCGGDYKNTIYKIDGAYSHWSYNQPNNFDNYQGCGTLESRTSWKMGDEPCFEKFPYICQLPLTSCPPGAWLLKGRCLLLQTSVARTFFESRADCKSMNGDLVSVNTREIHEALSAKLQIFGLTNTQVWIGLVGKQWLWSTGETFLFSNWEPNEPDNFDKNCMVFHYNYKGYFWWKDEKCSRELPYVCYMEGQVTSSTEHATTTNRPEVTTGHLKLTTWFAMKPGSLLSTNPADITETAHGCDGSFTTTPTPATTVTRGTPLKTGTSTTVKPSTTTAKTTNDNNNNNDSTSMTTDLGVLSSTLTPSSTLMPIPSTRGPANNSMDPSIGASTGGQSGLSTTEIILIVVLGLVVLVCIIVVICCCYFKKADGCCASCTGKRERTVVYPEKTVDARKQVLLPYSEYYGDHRLPQDDYSPAGSTTGLILNAGMLEKKLAPEENAENHYLSYQPAGLTRLGSKIDRNPTSETRTEKKRKRRAKRYTEPVVTRTSDDYEELNPVENPPATSMRRILIDE